MFETEDEIRELQALLDRSHASRGAHLGSIVTDDRRLNARQIVAYFQGVKPIAFGTVSAAGNPLVAPLDGVFLHGRFVTGTAPNAVRARHVRRNPIVSLCHVPTVDFGVWVHGEVVADVGPGTTLGDEWDRVMAETYGQSIWAMYPDAVAWRVEPRAMFTFAMEPEKWPEA